jgi:hypothetical protein
MLFKNNINIACFFNKKIEQNNFKYLINHTLELHFKIESFNRKQYTN